MMGRRILLPSLAKAMLMSIKIIEGESSYPARANTATDSMRSLFPTDACTNVSWTSLGVALLVSMDRLGKLSQTFLNFSKAGLLVRMIS